MWHPDGPLPTVLYLPGHDDSVTEQDQFDTTNGIRKAPQGSPTAQKIRFLSGCCYNIFEPRGIYSHFARRHGQHFFPLTGWMLRIILWFTCVQVTFLIWRMTYMSTYFAANAGYVFVCFLPIHSGHQVRWTYQPGSHRRKVTQDF